MLTQQKRIACPNCGHEMHEWLSEYDENQYNRVIQYYCSVCEVDE